MKKLFVISLVFFSTINIAQDKPDYSAKFSGYVRAWYQADLATNQSSYSVKQVRLGIAGYVNEYAGYKALVDFTRLGKLSSTTTTVNGVKVVNNVSASFSDILLDAMAILKPIESLEITAGQFKVPFSTDNLKSDQNHEFTSRPLLTSVSPNMRDIGFMMTYKIKGSVNAELSAGSFNGSGMNKTENDKTLDYALRALVSPIKDLAVFANYYGGKVTGVDQTFLGFGTSFKYNSLLLEGEYAGKTLSALTGDINGSSYFGLVTYNIKTNGSLLNEIIPAFRYEVYDPLTDKDNNEIGKMTIGLTFNFAKITFAHFRINYEKFDNKDGTTNPDKLTLELQTKF